MLKHGEIRGWVIDVDGCDLDALPPLSAEEEERALRFHSQDVRRRYVAAHRALRRILALLDLPPVIERNQRGKPSLPGCDHQFSLSRSGSKAMIALACGLEVGADIEQVRTLPELDQIAERFMPPSAYSEFQLVPAASREREFFRVWTRTEAVLKASGMGLFGAGQELEGEWTVEEIGAGDGYVGAIAARGPGHRIHIEEFR